MIYVKLKEITDQIEDGLMSADDMKNIVQAVKNIKFSGISQMDYIIIKFDNKEFGIELHNGKLLDTIVQLGDEINPVKARFCVKLMDYTDLIQTRTKRAIYINLDEVDNAYSKAS